MEVSEKTTWHNVKLSDVVHEVRELYSPKKSEDLSYLGLEHIGQGNLQILQVGKSSQLQSQKKRFQKEDTLFGTLRSYFRKVASPTFDGVCSTDIAVLRAKEGLDPKFLFYFIANPFFINFASNPADGTRMPRASWKYLESTSWLMPELKEQKRIGLMLSAFDDKIDNNNRVIKALEEMAQAIFKEWFVRFRFPGHEKAEFVDSEMGRTPKGWATKRLGDVIELAYGKALKDENRKPGNVAVVGSSGIVGVHNFALVKGPGIVVGRKGTAGTVIWLDQDFFPIDTTFYVKTDLPIRYTYFLLRGQKFITGDSAVPGLNRDQAYFNQLILPDRAILDEFEKLVTPIFIEKYQLAKENKLLNATRDFLLPKLMSGKVGV